MKNFVGTINDNVNKISDKISKKDHIQGIHCEVTNCMFHDEKSKCCASQIKVGPTFAANNGDTLCSTFKLK